MTLDPEEKRLVEKLIATIKNFTPTVKLTGNDKIYKPGTSGKPVNLGKKPNIIISEDNSL